MRRYVAGKAAGDGGLEHPDSREWVFGMLETPRYRERMEQLERLDLRRRSGCEQCLRALVVDDWTPDALYHVGWCESCRSAAIALGMHSSPAARAGWFRRRAAWLVVAAAVAAIAVPLVASQVISNQDSRLIARGGSAHAIGIAGKAGKSGGAVGTDTPVTPVSRSKRPGALGHVRGAKSSRQAAKKLPLTT